MEALIVIGLIWAIIAIISHIRKKSSSGRPSSTTYRRPDSSIDRSKHDPNVYHPSTSPRTGSGKGIQFHNNGGGASSLTDLDIKDLVDALTGAPLKPHRACINVRGVKSSTKSPVMRSFRPKMEGVASHVSMRKLRVLRAAVIKEGVMPTLASLHLAITGDS